jgi:hypothetical protein
MPVPPAHPDMKIRAPLTRPSRMMTRSFLDRAWEPTRIIPHRPTACNWIHIAIGRSWVEPKLAACATAAVVEMLRVTVAGFPPGATLVGDRLQVVRAGAPAQLIWTVLVNGPPSGLRVSVWLAVMPALTVSPGKVMAEREGFSNDRLAVPMRQNRIVERYAKQYR